MRRPPHPRRSPKRTAPTPLEIRHHLAQLLDAMQVEWQYQLVSMPEMDWTRLLSLHLQMCELEGIEAGVQEFFR
jgi:hypothetical protein